MIKRSAFCVLLSAEAALCAALACDPNIVIGRYQAADSNGGGSGPLPEAGMPDAPVTAGTGGTSGAGGSAGSTVVPEAGGGGEGGSAGSPEPTLLWSADHETADMSEWEEEGGYYSTGDTPEPSDARAHSGQYSLEFTIDTTDGEDKVVRVYRSTVPEPAYYSAWFYFEEAHVQQPWWSMFVFVQATDLTDPGTIYSVWDLNLDNVDGALIPYVYDHLTGDNTYGTVPVPVPVGEWVHLEFYLNYAPPSDTELDLYVNGELAVEVDGLGEPEDPFLGWSVGNGSGGLDPPVSTIYVDDAAISTVRLGP